MKVYTVFDSKAEVFAQPMFFVTRAVALRAFADACATAGSDFSKYSSDYTLFEIGEFDEHTGKWSALPAMLNLGLAAQFLGKES